MKLGVKVKEKLARAIGEYFTTNEIANVFTGANITVDKSLYAKWRITLDAFNKIATEEGFFHILGEFCHPLNFEGKEKTRQDFIETLNNILSYEEIEIQPTERTVRIVSISGSPQSDFSKPTSKTKTSIDYVIEAINFFKNEYNKVRVSGLEYDYELGENFAKANGDISEEDADKHTFKLKAIEQLKNVGFITEYKIEERVENEGYYVWDYAICKIDESKLTQKEAPKATDAGVEAITQKVIHEHTHRFENSIQEKGIDLKHIFEKENKVSFYITKKGDDFYYKGLHILATKKNTDYCKVFCALYAKLPEGGEISYKDLIAEIKSRMPEQKSKTNDEMQKFIQGNLTDRSNGFMRYAKIPKTEDNGKPLISIIRGSGVVFNNKAG